MQQYIPTKMLKMDLWQNLIRHIFPKLMKNKQGL